jgi:hypothetical protein
MYCYKFPSREDFLTLADAEGLVDADGNLITGGHGFAIDEIGPIIQGGEWDGEGNVIVPPTIIEGHHVNVMGDVPEAWDAYLLVVNSPVRIFFGGPTSAPPDVILDEMVL